MVGSSPPSRIMIVHDSQGSGKTSIPFNINNPNSWRQPFVLDPDGSVRVTLPKNGSEYSLEELQQHVGGNIEIHHIPLTNNQWIAVLNEEGKIQNPPLPTNAMATKLLELDVIVGRILVCPMTMAS